MLIAMRMEVTFLFVAYELDNRSPIVQEQMDAHFMILMRMIHTFEFSTKSKEFFGVLTGESNPKENTNNEQIN